MTRQAIRTGGPPGCVVLRCRCSSRYALRWHNYRSNDFSTLKLVAVIADATCRPLALYRLYIGSISASPTACPLRGYGLAGNQNDRLGKKRPHGRAGLQAADGCIRSRAQRWGVGTSPFFYGSTLAPRLVFFKPRPPLDPTTACLYLGARSIRLKRRGAMANSWTASASFDRMLFLGRCSTEMLHRVLIVRLLRVETDNLTYRA